jgi:excinuclease ABC subunit A
MPPASSPGPIDSMKGLAKLDKTILVDQQPIGSTPGSTPATYTGVFDPIRQLFAKVPESAREGFTPRTFSFNVPGAAANLRRPRPAAGRDALSA